MPSTSDQSQAPTKGKLGHKKVLEWWTVLRNLLHNTNNSLTQCALKIVGGEKQAFEDISALWEWTS